MKRLCVGIPIAAALLIIAYDRIAMVWWVGSTDLQVDFEVVEEGTGEPIEGATIRIEQSEGGFCEDRSAAEFELVTDAAGRASRSCRRCMCFGTESGLRFTDTFSSHLPKWRVAISAPGHSDSISKLGDSPEHSKSIRRIEKGLAAVTIRGALTRTESTATVPAP